MPKDRNILLHKAMKRSDKVKVIHIITRQDRGGSAQNTLLTVLGLDKTRYTVKLIKGSSLESNMDQHEKELVDRDLRTAMESGIEVVDVDSLVRRIDPWCDLRSFWTILKVIKREKPHIVHTHTSKAGLLGRWAAFLAGVPVIIHTPHGHIFNDYFNPGLTKCFTFAEKISALITDRMVALTDRERDEHLDQGVGTNEKFITIHSGVELDRFIDLNVDIKAKKRYLGIPEDYNVVGTIGRLVTIKGHRYLIEAAKCVIEKAPRTVFVFIGDGDLERELEEQARALEIRKNIIFAGWRSDVAEILYTFDILAFPSLNEGMGKVLVEAMVACKPIVASMVGGIVDLVKHGVNGILVPPKDSEALCRGILRLLTNKDLANQLGKCGRRMIYPAFDVSTMIRKIERLYEGLR